MSPAQHPSKNPTDPQKIVRETSQTIFDLHRDAEDMINAGEEDAGFGLLQDAQNLLFGTLDDIQDEEGRVMTGKAIYEELARLWESNDAAAEAFQDSEVPIVWEKILERILDEELPEVSQARAKAPRF